MNCPNCKAIIHYHDIKDSGYYYCIKCGEKFQNNNMDFETESDLAVTANGTIRLRSRFLNQFDFFEDIKLSFYFNSTLDYGFLPSNNGIEIERLKSGGYGLKRNIEFIKIIRILSGIKSGESAFFKLIKNKNIYKMEQISYKSLVAESVKKTAIKKAKLSLTTTMFSISSGAMMIMGLEKGDRLNVFIENKDFFISISEKQDDENSYKLYYMKHTANLNSTIFLSFLHTFFKFDGKRIDFSLKKEEREGKVYFKLIRKN